MVQGPAIPRYSVKGFTFLKRSELKLCVVYTDTYSVKGGEDLSLLFKALMHCHFKIYITVQRNGKDGRIE